MKKKKKEKEEEEEEEEEEEGLKQRYAYYWFHFRQHFWRNTFLIKIPFATVLLDTTIEYQITCSAIFQEAASIYESKAFLREEMNLVINPFQIICY